MIGENEFRPCPCQFKEIGPCQDGCSCVNPVSSVGCDRCPRYGSYDQRLWVAKRIAEAMKQAYPPRKPGIVLLCHEDELCAKTHGHEGPCGL